MIKSELISRIAGQNPHLFVKDVEKVVNAIFDGIEAGLVRRERVELRGFGIFTVKSRSARSGRNPKTGAFVSVPETHHPNSGSFAIRAPIFLASSLVIRFAASRRPASDSK
jgi:integration host factor subunit beta